MRQLNHDQLVRNTEMAKVLNNYAVPAPGLSIRIRCPFCDSPDKTMSVSNTDKGIAYNCFRASCKCAGYIDPTKVIRTINNTSKSTNTSTNISTNTNTSNKYYTKPLVGIKRSIREHIHKKYGIYVNIIDINNWKYAYVDKALYFPIFDYLGAHRGAMIKRLEKQEGVPKTISYVDKEYVERVHFPKSNVFSWQESKLPFICVTEDILSATKICQRYPCISLNGVHINDAAMIQLSTMTNTILLMLDPDTWVSGTIQRLKQKLSFMFDKVEAIVLDKDPKDTRLIDLWKVIELGVS